jgi:hypothetical protein
MMENDPLHIPDAEITWHQNKQTALTHIFKRTLPKREFRFQVLRGVALKGYTYKVVVDGEEMVMVPDQADDTWLTCQIKPNAKVAEITLNYPLGEAQVLTVKKEHKYTVQLGHLRPADTPEGREDRLTNLGYMVPLPNKGHAALYRGDPDPQKALSIFQASHGIDPADGISTGPTIEKLKERTGDPA